MNKSEFQELLRLSTKLSYNFAENYVLDKLPKIIKYTVKLNISVDDTNLKQFDIYPTDNNKIFELISEKEVVDLLCRNEKIPVWIDISVDSIKGNSTIFELLCAGRYSSNPNEFYYLKGGTGPFGIKSPTLPIDYKQGTKFKLKWRKQKLFLYRLFNITQIKRIGFKLKNFFIKTFNMKKIHIK